MSSHHGPSREEGHLERPVEEILRLARPIPTHEEMVIDDIDDAEGRAFLAAVAE